MAKKHINKNKFKGSLKTVFTDVVCRSTVHGFDDSDTYYPICKDNWSNFPDEFPSSIVGPVPFNVDGYDDNNRPYFSGSSTPCSQWPVLITPSGITTVNENIAGRDLSPLNFPLGPYSDGYFEIDRTHIFIGTKKLTEEYPDINDIKKYPQFWKEVWYIRLDLGMYGLHYNVYGKVILAEKVFSDTTEEWLLR
jgi:hypothetical protein